MFSQRTSLYFMSCTWKTSPTDMSEENEALVLGENSLWTNFLPLFSELINRKPWAEVEVCWSGCLQNRVCFFPSFFLWYFFYVFYCRIESVMQKQDMDRRREDLEQNHVKMILCFMWMSEQKHVCVSAVTPGPSLNLLTEAVCHSWYYFLVRVRSLALGTDPRSSDFTTVCYSSRFLVLSKLLWPSLFSSCHQDSVFKSNLSSVLRICHSLN